MSKDNLQDQQPQSINLEPPESFGDSEENGFRITERIQAFRAGTLLLGISVDQISAIAPWRPPTPLPNAPAAVLGVVSLQGRMLTVLDPLRLLEQDVNEKESSWAHIVSLRGDEQLALAVEHVDGEVVLPSAGLEPAPVSSGLAVAGLIKNDDQVIRVIEVKELFATAMRERRRRRRQL